MLMAEEFSTKKAAPRWIDQSPPEGTSYWLRYVERVSVNVNPTKEKGQQLMDAGRVYFTSGARLNNKCADGCNLVEGGVSRGTITPASTYPFIQVQ